MPSSDTLPPLKVKDLASSSGIARLSEALGASLEQSEEIRRLTKLYLESSPELADIPVGKTKGTPYYDITNNRLALASGDPDVYSHELEHAVRLSGASKTYKSLLALSKKFTALNNAVAGPAAAAVAMTVKDKALEKELLRGAAAVGAISAVPNLLEEAVASGRAYSKSSDKYRTIKTLLPAFGSHAIHDLAAPSMLLGLSNVGN